MCGVESAKLRRACPSSAHGIPGVAFPKAYNASRRFKGKLRFYRVAEPHKDGTAHLH